MISIPGSLSFSKLVMMSSAPAKSAGGSRYATQDPFIHSNQHCPIQSRLQSVLGACSFYIECNKTTVHLIEICHNMLVVFTDVFRKPVPFMEHVGIQSASNSQTPQQPGHKISHITSLFQHQPETTRQENRNRRSMIMIINDNVRSRCQPI